MISDFCLVSPLLLGVAGTVGIILAMIFLYTLPHKRAHLPPGPPALPIIGNLHHIPSKYPWISLAHMKNEYGGLIYFHGLGNSILVLNDLDIMLDLLLKKGNTHCSRPNLVVACELMDLIHSTAFVPFGDAWKLHRKFCHTALSADATRSYDGVLMDIALRLTNDLHDLPTDFTNHVRLMAGRVIMSSIYGISVETVNDPYIVQAEATMNIISKAVVPGEFLVDLIPFLKYIPSWFPFTRFHKVGKEGKEMIAELVRRPFQFVQKEMNAGTAAPSFTRDILTKPELELERSTDPTFEHTIQWAAASMYAAGQEVVSSSILSMILGLALNPEKMKTAQMELDCVIGREHRPTVQDRQSLPYVHAIVKETLRWHPPLPMDIARSSIKEDQYKGFFIPKNTTLIPNIWVIAHTPDPEYPAHMFLPERFLPGRTNPPPDPASYCFGFGRRICPGRALAENALFLMTASIIQAFDISPAVDQSGHQIPINVNYSSGLVSLPEGFQCDIKPRGT